MAKVTPMMKQYLETKQKAGDCLLFFRLGDFYELFFEDAEVASRELELVLTGKDCGLDTRAPMCGIPYHAATSYIGRLVSRGYKVAVCEQMEDPATAKGIVKRDIIKVYTPGTVTDDSMLDQKSNNYIAAVFGIGSFYGLACCDITTGEFRVTSFTVGASLTHLRDEIARLMPKELVVNVDCAEADSIVAAAETYSGAFASKIGPEFFELEDAEASLERIVNAKKKIKSSYKEQKEYIGGNEGKPVSETESFDKADPWAIRAAGCLIRVLEDTQKLTLEGIIRPVFYKTNEFMTVDAQSRRNLEITESMRDRKKYGSLLWVLDKTETAMGGRKLRSWIETPLIDREEINLRQDAVAELFDKFMLRSEIIEHLKGVYDIERLAGRVTMGSGNAREMLSLKQSLIKLPALKNLLKDAGSGLLRKLYEKIDPLENLADLLERAIADDPPVTITDGDIIKKGFDPQIDHYREANNDGKRWLSELEARERERTGIKKLKVGYNTVFGYYIEVSNSFKELVPADYVRKQTLTNAERYITDELKKLETELLDAERNLRALEEKRFREVRDFAAGYSQELHENADAVAVLDVLCSFATVAERENYVRPEMTDDTVIELKNGRHPVVEKMPGCDVFVPNDAKLDCGDNMLLVITGPNMAGKSTYMRMVALIVLMAQTGSFVPADAAVIGIADKLFTRVGASDDLAQGRSTFMVEMCEVANIVENATSKSLLILDEIGRGTSTFDGLSIAWAVLEFIAGNLKSRTLFATHYHELTELEDRIEGVKNYCVDVKRKGDEITFLRKIKRGGADGSYGISVAMLAGLPKAITIRAKEILATLEEADLGKKEMKNIGRKKESASPDLFSFAAAAAMQDDIITELKELDVTKMTPMECMNTLYSLSKRANDRK